MGLKRRWYQSVGWLKGVFITHCSEIEREKEGNGSYCACVVTPCVINALLSLSLSVFFSNCLKNNGRHEVAVSLGVQVTMAMAIDCGCRRRTCCMLIALCLSTVVVLTKYLASGRSWFYGHG